jgi:hypothetical protein
MPHQHEKQHEPVHNAMKRCFEAMNEREPAKAAKHFRKALEFAGRLGIVSPSIYWHLAIASDYSGDAEVAFDCIDTAIELDPFCNAYRESYDIIANRIRSALVDAERAADDPSTPQLYDLLVRHDEADLPAHVAMTRFWTATGCTDKAATLAAALTLLHPTVQEAWACRREVALARNDEPTVAACDLEIGALRARRPSVPLLMPMRACTEVA